MGKKQDGIDTRENEEQRRGRNKDTQINHTYIGSGEYRRKFDGISKSEKLNRLLYQLSKEMLERRAGSKLEDMYWIDIDAVQIVASELDSDVESKIIYSERTKSVIKRLNQSDRNIMTIHSHPNSNPPSIDDFISNFQNGYGISLVICHDGTIFLYEANEELSVKYYEMTLAEYLQDGYNEREAQVLCLQELQQKFDIVFKEVMDYGNGK